ncbi:hypothetical protein DSO57_1020778 [Entomophthora muscae]|uniref:Uncharacterized protein n=1 Tax=Entomophthora muscae TaxID=34485 RepID=A0ACC2TRA8_9FUNG|nr:hypothetical protein DSO57_1020778 [Entomophthora muscae]
MKPLLSVVIFLPIQCFPSLNADVGSENPNPALPKPSRDMSGTVLALCLLHSLSGTWCCSTYNLPQLPWYVLGYLAAYFMLEATVSSLAGWKSENSKSKSLKAVNPVKNEILILVLKTPELNSGPLKMTCTNQDRQGHTNILGQRLELVNYPSECQLNKGDSPISHQIAPSLVPLMNQTYVEVGLPEGG